MTTTTTAALYEAINALSATRERDDLTARVDNIVANERHAAHATGRQCVNLDYYIQSQYARTLSLIADL